ncbi:hypothetical protein AB0C34_14915 [Nocardia sp. NPDC049220]|uniref:hypothetical protein n=1 Tax=Nocardia sp. NPDC049220 TaxID=3155273 RepID=UPI0033CE1430
MPAIGPKHSSRTLLHRKCSTASSIRAHGVGRARARARQREQVITTAVEHYLASRAVIATWEVK